MAMFLMVAALVAAFVVGAWLKLAPSPDERRRARLREGALAAGLRVRWMPPAESTAHGLPAGLVWYVLPAADPQRASELAFRRDAGWGREASGGAEPSPAVPAGVWAVRTSASDVAVAWDERATENITEIHDALRRLAQRAGG